MILFNGIPFTTSKFSCVFNELYKIRPRIITRINTSRHPNITNPSLHRIKNSPPIDANKQPQLTHPQRFFQTAIKRMYNTSGELVSVSADELEKVALGVAVVEEEGEVEFAGEG